MSFVWASLSLPFRLFECLSFLFGGIWHLWGLLITRCLPKGRRAAFTFQVLRTNRQAFLGLPAFFLKISALYEPFCQVSMMFCSNYLSLKSQQTSLLNNLCSHCRDTRYNLSASVSVLPRSVSPNPSRGVKESCKSICIRHLTSISHVLGEWHHLLLCGFVERREDGWLSSRPS